MELYKLEESETTYATREKQKRLCSVVMVAGSTNIMCGRSRKSNSRKSSSRKRSSSCSTKLVLVFIEIKKPLTRDAIPQQLKEVLIALWQCRKRALV